MTKPLAAGGDCCSNKKKEKAEGGVKMTNLALFQGNKDSYIYIIREVYSVVGVSGSPETISPAISPHI